MAAGNNSMPCNSNVSIYWLRDSVLERVLETHGGIKYSPQLLAKSATATYNSIQKSAIDFPRSSIMPGPLFFPVISLFLLLRLVGAHGFLSLPLASPSREVKTYTKHSHSTNNTLILLRCQSIVCVSQRPGRCRGWSCLLSFGRRVCFGARGGWNGGGSAARWHCLSRG